MSLAHQPRPYLVRYAPGLLAVASLLIAPAALAQMVPTIPSNGAMDNLANLMSNRATGWLTTAQTFARDIFYGLAAIEVTWAGIEYTLRKHELTDLIVSIVFKLLAICFFYFVLINFAPTWIPLIIQSFAQMGSTVGGTTIAQLSPSAVFQQGITLAGALFTRAAQGNFLTEVTGVLESLPAMLILMFSFAFVALKLLITLAEADIVLAGALPMLGFLGSRWTSLWGEKYFGYAVSVGVKLMMLYLVIGLGSEIFTDEQNFFSGDTGPPTFSDMYQYALAAFLYAGVAWSVPSIAGAVMSGAPAMGIGGLIAPIATTAAGTLAATAAGSAAVHAAAAGGAQALERLSALTSSEGAAAGTAEATEKLATMSAQTGPANAATGGASGAGAAGLDHRAHSSSAAPAAASPGERASNDAEPQARTGADESPSSNNASSQAATDAPSEHSASVDAVDAPSGSAGPNPEESNEEAGTKAQKLLRAAQEASRRFQHHASAFAEQAQNMPQSYTGLSIRIRHPEE